MWKARSTLRSRIRTCWILSLLFAPTTDSTCIGENGKDGFWGDILSGLERLGEVICDISPLYKVFEETFEENRIFEDILWVEEIGLEEKARMLMGYSDNEGDSDESAKSHVEAENE